MSNNNYNIEIKKIFNYNKIGEIYENNYQV